MNPKDEQPKRRHPDWVKARLPKTYNAAGVRSVLSSHGLHTVCEEARCPNRGECWDAGTATFLILGDTCTRSCRYCGVKHGLPATPNNEEPEKLAQAVKLLSCRYVVITSVTRDDLPDGGAALYAAAVKKIKETNPGVKVELLIPDFMGSEEALKTVLDASPDVLGHNIEVVRSLFSSHRPQGGYQRSMLLISNSKKLRPDVLTKSGLMAGLGETRDEISGTLRDLRGAGCDIVTAGQYLQPSKECVTVERYLEPEEFREIEAEALGLGFVSAKCGPLVRSSYRAEQLNTEISEK